jgi:V/A-type H+-transporting ATPase subunit D
MAKIRLTKNELKKQKDSLQRFQRYVPTLELKKKQLLQEINRIRRHIEALKMKNQQAEKEADAWVDVFAEKKVDLESLIRIKSLETERGNIAGIEIPIFRDLTFEDISYDLFRTPLWVDSAVEMCCDLIRRRAEWEISEKQEKILQEELRITIQRVKLFEEVKIPEAKEAIRVIQIFLGDQQTAEVVRGKIAKSKIEKKKLQVDRV